MADDLVLYTNPQSRGRIARWMLEEVGVPYETEILEYGTTMKGADYLAINPMGKVPALRHGKTVVTECAAICAYLADAFPDAKLAPPLTERGDYYRWMFFAAGPVEAAWVNRSLGVELAPEKQMMAGYGSFEAVMDTLEQAVTDKEFIVGSAFSAADVYVGAEIDFGLRMGSWEKRPAFVKYVDRLTAREAYKRAWAIDDGAAPAR